MLIPNFQFIPLHFSPLVTISLFSISVGILLIEYLFMNIEIMLINISQVQKISEFYQCVFHCNLFCI